MIDPDSFIVQRDPTTGSLKYLIPEEAMSRHFGLPVYQERKHIAVPFRKVGWAMAVTFLGMTLLSFSVFWLKYRPRGVDRYAPAFSEETRSTGMFYVTATPLSTDTCIVWPGASE